MPGPSFRPLIASIALTVLFYGLVFGGPLLFVGLIMLVDLAAPVADGLPARVPRRRDRRRGRPSPAGTGRPATRARRSRRSPCSWSAGCPPDRAPATAQRGRRRRRRDPERLAAPRGRPGRAVSPRPRRRRPRARATPRSARSTSRSSQAEVTAPAARPFKLRFLNKDAGVPAQRGDQGRRRRRRCSWARSSRVSPT